MIDLTRLTVSLTKHNAHKLAALLKEHDANQVLARLSDVHADRPQALKILSVERGQKLPGVWRKAQLLGDQAIEGLLFVGIIFSHHQLIRAMEKAIAAGDLSAVIRRNAHLKGKVYTNFVRIADQLGFAKDRNKAQVTVDLESLLRVRGLGPLVGELLTLKMRAAGWTGPGAVQTAAARIGLNNSLGLSAKAFKDWTTEGLLPKAARITILSSDESFFGSNEEGSSSYTFNFRPGHTERAVTPVGRTASSRTVATQLHNNIQNKLYTYLAKRLGSKNVGTEIRTGKGTSIDLVTKTPEQTVFYEIKTSASVRTSIRQAIPQLLEYAHWPNEKRADRFVIVSHLAATRAALRYLTFLRTTYAIPLHYAHFDTRTNTLKEH